MATPIESRLPMAWALLFALAVAASAASAQELTLDAGDRVSVSVQSRDDMSGTYLVRSDGMLSMHVLGEVPARGLTVSQLERNLEAGLSDLTKLPASVTVEVGTWRPVFVLGDVQSPGAFPFAEGLTVEQAVALAGGYFRLAATNTSGVDLRISDEAAQAQWLEIRLKELAVIRTRLEAEAAGKPTLEFDSGGDPDLAEIVAEQQAILTRRGASLSESIAAANRALDLARAEAEALAEQQSLLQARIADQEANVEKVRTLFEKGLTSADRMTQEERSLNADRIELMTASTYEARARQQMAQAEATIADLQTAHQRDIAAELADIASQEREATLGLQSARGMLARFGASAGVTLPDGSPMLTVYQVSRGADADVQLIALNAGDSLRPGDTLTVLRLPPAEPSN
ncbi:MAG: polysaccharide biosynthesis/export family protein [Paracoccaceae bacterium]